MKSKKSQNIGNMQIAGKGSPASRLQLAKTEDEIADAIAVIGADMNIGRILLACRNRLNLLATVSSDHPAGVIFFPGSLEAGAEATDFRTRIRDVIDNRSVPSHPMAVMTGDGLESLNLLTLLENKPLYLSGPELISAPIFHADREYYLVITLNKPQLDQELFVRLQVILSAVDTALRRILADHMPRSTALSAREHQVLRWICQGKTSFEISRILQLSEYTVNNYIANLTKKIGAVNRGHAIAMGICHNMI